ncbi:hypothetical protein NWP17_17070 [Chrysosporum bergii ANA360D]|uniref:SPOR domain-containing protein n=1 Tax=Chrysosporum bergii ANA360D TaxID=617107 RepID=A0AA43GV16_9CYAN|nr:hypothetical protein [Chrysosporum bergii]MDH6062124.1 hypothetical protein [Chrysosporum bergii ANA360D]
MNQNPLINSGTKSLKTSGIKPALAAALASLEVPIDQELARYRRTKIGFKIPQQPPDLPDNPAMDKVAPPLLNKNTPSQPAWLLNETPEENPTATNTEVDDFNSPSTNSASSIVPAVVNAENDHASQPNEYLESSEALLRTLTDEQQSPKKPSHSQDSLLSPLGIGSILLLLVASVTLGYLVFNPNSYLSRFLPGDSSANTEENTKEVDNNAQPQSETKEIFITKYPNLAAKEFPQVRNPTDIVGLQPKVKPTPRPIMTQPSVTPPEVIKPSLPQSQPVPAVNTASSSTTATAKPLPEKTTTPPQANAELKPATDGFYHIVMDNQGDGALSTAQQVVPDAYLSPGQTLIYLGALKTPEAARERVKQLQSQGLKARIQQQ